LKGFACSSFSFWSVALSFGKSGACSFESFFAFLLPVTFLDVFDSRVRAWVLFLASMLLSSVLVSALPEGEADSPSLALSCARVRTMV
jgi:hypothetical protein